MNEDWLIQQSVDQAAADIATQSCGEWADWVIYLLEALEGTIASSLGLVEDAILERVEGAIKARLANGRWSS